MNTKIKQRMNYLEKEIIRRGYKLIKKKKGGYFILTNYRKCNKKIELYLIMDGCLMDGWLIIEEGTHKDRGYIDSKFFWERILLWLKSIR